MDLTNSLSNFEFASLAQYSAQGRSEYSIRCKGWTHRLKDTPAPLVSNFCEAIEKACSEGPTEFYTFFGEDVLAIPAPGHALMKNAAGHWGPRNLCEAMQTHHLVGAVDCCLHRIVTVAKSAYARTAAERPDYQAHLESMAVQNPCRWQGKVLLVDDVITRGCTMAAGIQLLNESFPEAESVRGFAFVRSMSHQEIDTYMDPVLGKITLFENGEVDRDP